MNKMEIKLNKDNFEEVLKSEKPVLVDFWATWCGPCRMLAPALETVAKEYADRMTVGKVNVDEEMELAIRYKIVSIPALYLFENGEVKAKSIGYMDEGELKAFVDANL